MTRHPFLLCSFLAVSLLALPAQAKLHLEASEPLDKSKYPVSNAVDGNPKTAYCTKADSPWMEVFIPSNKSVVKLVLNPGYQKSKAIYAANSRPRAVKVLVYDEAGQSAATVEMALPEGYGVKTEIPIPQLKEIRASKIRFDFGPITFGKFPEVCVSEIELKLVDRLKGASSEEKAFLQAHAKELTLEGLSTHSQILMRFAELTSRAKDTKNARAILKLTEAGLDGFYATQYSLLLFEFIKGDPEFAVGQMRSFFKENWETPLMYLCNEAGDVDTDALKALLATIPPVSEHSRAAKQLSLEIDKKLQKIHSEAQGAK